MADMKLGIIFDMDGTLWDSSQGVTDSWNEIIQKHYPNRQSLTVDDIQGVMGLTMHKIADKLFADLSEDKRLELLEACENYENDYLRQHGGVLYTGLEDTLKKLKEQYHLYIVSNCQSGYIEAFLDHYGFWDYFEDIECFGNNGLQKGVNIRNVVERNHLDDAIYVGDIQGDYDATMQAGAKFLHAAYGFGTINAPVPRIEKISEITNVIGMLLG